MQDLKKTKADATGASTLDPFADPEALAVDTAKIDLEREQMIVRTGNAGVGESFHNTDPFAEPKIIELDVPSTDHEEMQMAGRINYDTPTPD